MKKHSLRLEPLFKRTKGLTNKKQKAFYCGFQISGNKFTLEYRINGGGGENNRGGVGNGSI